MFKIVIIASIMWMAYANRYAYFDNNLVEYDTASSHTISLPYPYKEPKLVQIAQLPSNIETVYDVRNAISSVAGPRSIISSVFGLICSIITSLIGCVKRAVIYVITSIPTLIFSFFGICNMTSWCKYLNTNSLFNVSDLTNFVPPERLQRASDFLETAIKKYKSLQL